MDCGPVQTMMHTISSCGTDKTQSSTQASPADQARNFFEEASFFASHFKNFTVRPMPDPSLMLLLQQGKWRQKQRKVNKKEKPLNLFMRKRKKGKEEDKDNFHESL